MWVGQGSRSMPSLQKSMVASNASGLFGFFFFFKGREGMELRSCLLSQKPLVSQAASFLDKWISSLAVSATWRSQGLLALAAVIGRSPRTDKLVCGFAERKVSSYQNQASPLRSRRSSRGGRSESSRSFKHYRSCPADWLGLSAASLEQKVKVDCSVNGERQPIKEHCLKKFGGWERQQSG